VIRNTLLSIVATLAVAAAVAHAGPGTETSSFGTLSVWGSNPPSFGGTSGGAPAAFGGQYQFGWPVGQSHRWVAAPAVGIGYGQYKTQTSGSPSYTSSAVTWDALLDFLYYNDCCDDDDFYCGPGIYYESTSPKYSPSTPSFTFDPVNTFGGELTVGGGVPFGSRMQWVGSITERFGYTTENVTEFGAHAKFSSTTLSTQVSGGLRWGF